MALDPVTILYDEPLNERLKSGADTRSLYSLSIGAPRFSPYLFAFFRGYPPSLVTTPAFDRTAAEPTGWRLSSMTNSTPTKMKLAPTT
jgi:hypothetical protein